MDNSDTSPPVFRIATLLYDNLLGTSVTLPVEMLKTAEAAAAALGHNPNAVESVLVSVDGNPAKTASGIHFSADYSLADAPPCNLINAPALWRNPRPALRKSREFIPWLKDHAEQGAWLTAVGTGACFLAETGLLNNQPATTHWHYFDRFQKDYPQVDLKRQYFTTQAGNLFCAASVNAMAELMVHLCNRLYGRQAAAVVERNFFHEIRNTYEPNSFFSEQTTKHADEKILQAQIWLEDNFGQQVNIGELAARFEFSHRNFDRRFRAALGVSPVKYLQEIRLKNACELLTHSNLSINETASVCGYQSASTFTQLFKKTFHATPRHYRETVRAKLFSKQQVETLA